MIYRFFKAVHGFTAFIGLMLLFMAASTSDLSVIELGQKEPESVGTLLVWVVILMIPTAIYLALDYYKRRFMDR